MRQSRAGTCLTDFEQSRQMLRKSAEGQLKIFALSSYESCTDVWDENFVMLRILTPKQLWTDP